MYNALQIEGGRMAQARQEQKIDISGAAGLIEQIVERTHLNREFDAPGVAERIREVIELFENDFLKMEVSRGLRYRDGTVFTEVRVYLLGN